MTNANHEKAFQPAPITLTGQHARLEPLELRHAADLFQAGNEPEMWAYMPIPMPSSVGAVEEMIRTAHAQAASAGPVPAAIPFAIIDVASGRAVGSTRYLDIQPAHRGLEIGWTWVGPEFRRTAVNTECKLLLLEHAFEAHGAIRVQLKTDSRNVRSQTAIARLGAQREGVLRNHMIVQGGHFRDSVYFSITADEWPGVKQGLLEKLGREG